MTDPKTFLKALSAPIYTNFQGRDFWSDFERYSVLGTRLWNPKQQRRSKKSSNDADSATNLILACLGIRLQCTECTIWPRIGAPKKREFSLNIFQKAPKNAFFWPVISKFCRKILRLIKFDQSRVFLMLWESSENQFGRPKK